MSIEADIVKLIAAEFDKTEQEVRNAKSWNDLDFDSLDTVELVMKIEEVYNISFSDEETQAVKNLNDLMTLIDLKR